MTARAMYGMAAATSHNVIVSAQSHRWNSKNSRLDRRTANVRLVSVGSCCSGNRKLGLVCASGSQSSVIDPVHLPSNGKGDHSPKKSSESSLILIRHGESMWNEKNLFTGCVDVPLTPKGVDEAIEADDCNACHDAASAQEGCLVFALTNAVPIITHKESEQAQSWSKIYSEDTKEQSIPVITAWQLNERMYGELQGLNKQETADRFGKEQVHEWRRSYDTPPPNGESLEMCADRAVSYFKDQVISLELSTGIPMLYIFKEGEFIRRGSPVGPSEASVYAYTRNLATYRDTLDSMVQ
uniref:Phosphoglycerate mutase n=1 Tax=Aegilops tauschii TaxID=37682 RepID=M8B0G9_AEGTA